MRPQITVFTIKLGLPDPCLITNYCSFPQFKLEDAAPEVVGPSVTASAIVEPNTTAAVTTVSGLLRRPQSLGVNNVGTGSPITSPITATLRPVSAPFLPHQSPSPTPPTTTTSTTEATSNDRVSLATQKSPEETKNNDDKGEFFDWLLRLMFNSISLSSVLTCR